MVLTPKFCVWAENEKSALCSCQKFIGYMHQHPAVGQDGAGIAYGWHTTLAAKANDTYTIPMMGHLL